MIYAWVKCLLVDKWARIRKEDNGVHQEQECEEIIKGLFKKTQNKSVCRKTAPLKFIQRYLPYLCTEPTSVMLDQKKVLLQNSKNSRDSISEKGGDSLLTTQPAARWTAE